MWELPGAGGFNSPLNPPPQFDLFVCLGGSENNPQIALVYTICAIIALAQFLSRHLSTILYRYSIMTAVKIENLWFQLLIISMFTCSAHLHIAFTRQVMEDIFFKVK